MAELDYITVKGFRSIKSIERLHLRQINVLIGANGSGKSNFLAVFPFLNAIGQGNLSGYTAKKMGATKILHFGRRTKTIDLEVAFNAPAYGYHVNLAPTDDDRFFVREESWWRPEKQNLGKRKPRPLMGPSTEAALSDAEGTGVSKWLRNKFERLRLYHFHDTGDDSPIKLTVDLDDNRFLRSDGSNLAAFLFYLLNYHHSAYQMIRKMVQRVAPFFNDFQLAPLHLNKLSTKLEWSHKSSQGYWDASALSDGTLRFMCLATLFLQPADCRPGVILVDEPELGLHPFAIAMLSSMIKIAAKETQVIVSTQSPQLLDHFEPEDLIVAERVEEATTLSRLDSKQLAEWLGDYSLGQLWEKNQFGGRPGRG